MENAVEKRVREVRSLARSVYRRRWLALGTAAVLAVLGALASRALPERYEATARIHVDTQMALKPLMVGLTYQPDPNQQVAMLANTLISRINMEQLVQRPEFRHEARDAVEREALVDRLMQKIRVAPTAVANLYEIKYRGPSAADAKRVVQATVELFALGDVGARQQDARDAGRFIEGQVRAYEVKLVEAEQRLKDFKLRNVGITGVSDQEYFLRVSKLGDDVAKQRIDLIAAARSRDALRRELGSEEAAWPAEGTARADTPEGRVAAQTRVLEELLRRYTDAHPDVVAARRTLAALGTEARQQKELGGPRRAARAATSPVHRRLGVALAEADANVAALQSQLREAEARLEQARSLAGRLPQVEAELAQLNRDYEVIRKNHEQMVARREAASLGERLDARAHLAEFRLIDPVRAPASPVFPSRVQLAWGGLAMSLVLGVLLALLADLTRPTFDDLRSLREFSGRPVLGLLTPTSAAAIRRDKAEALRFATAVAVLGVLQLGWIGWLGTARVLG